MRPRVLGIGGLRPGVIVAGWFRVRSIKGRLALLALGLVTASLLAAGFLIHDAQRRSRSAFEEQLEATARAVAMVIDRQLAQAAAFNDALATSRTLIQGDFAAFDAHARRALAGRNAWILLTDPTGRQIVNTLKPYGEPLPAARGGNEEVWAALRAGRTYTGDLAVGRVAGRYVIAVNTPVRIDGEVRYALSYGFFPEALSELLRGQKLPPGRVATVIDRKLHVVARTSGGDEIVGRDVPPAFAAAINAFPEGSIETTSLDGVTVIAAFSRIETGWTVAVGVPAAELAAGADVPLLFAGSIALAIIGAGSLAAFLVARSIARSTTRLAGLAADLGEGKAVTFDPTGIDETDAVGEALAAASRRLDERERQLAESEERQRLAFQAAGIGTWDVEVTTGRRVWSDEFRQILGLPADFLRIPTRSRR